MGLIWLDSLPIATVDGTGSTSTFEYVHADVLGTPRVVTDANGATIWTWGFQGNPFGEASPVAVGGYTLNLRFPGQYEDSEVGLKYNLNRSFDAATGRYLQGDPLGLDVGASLYAYAGGNAFVESDPLGLCPGEECALVYRCKPAL